MWPMRYKWKTAGRPLRMLCFNIGILSPHSSYFLVSEVLIWECSSQLMSQWVRKRRAHIKCRGEERGVWPDIDATMTTLMLSLVTTLPRLPTSRLLALEKWKLLPGLSVGCNLTDTYVYTDHFEYLWKDTQETILIAASSWERKSGVGGRAQKTYFSFKGF